MTEEVGIFNRLRRKSMKKVHIMGMGGSGASAIAAIAKSQGFEVSGCDLQPINEFTTDLGIAVLTGHSSEHLTDKDILAITPAIIKFDPGNEEVREAKKQGIEILTWQEFMGKYLEKDKFVIAISGTHGKSTTTAMIGTLLEDAELDPTVELGAVVNKWGKNFRVGNSKYFVTEADEYNNNFLVSHPDITVVLNIDYDHPDFFKTLDSYKEAFYNFILQSKGTVVANLEDKNVSEVLKNVMKHSKVSSVDFNKNEVNLNLQIPGKHYLFDAKAAFQVGVILGIEPQKIIYSLNNFQGIGRRLEKIGQVNEAIVISSFGHHPTEIEADIEALKEKYSDKKLWVIFQPHLFSRTKLLFNDFVRMFKNLNVAGVMIAPIYPSREKDPGDINSKMLAQKIGDKKVEYVEDVVKFYPEMRKMLTKNDLVLFIGAGDTDKWAREFVND